jgi:ATP-dependent DNA ligase
MTAAAPKSATTGRTARGPAFAIAVDTPPMEARTAQELPNDEGEWRYEPKWDGFRCLAFKAGGEVELRAKSGKTLGRYFPEVVAMLRNLSAADFVIDGELVIERDGRTAFDALQMRLHPAASRIKKLAAATPAKFILFDMLAAPDAAILIGEPLTRRRQQLEALMRGERGQPQLTLSPFTSDLKQAEKWLGQAGEGSTDGVVAKRAADAYHPGERAMVKVKRLRTADCVVGGFRYASDSPLVGSLLLGLYDEQGKLDHVGFTAAIAQEDRVALTERLERLRGEPGFTGKAPGGPSRWSTERSGQWEPVRPKLVVEVRFDHVTADRFRHGTKLMRWRPDKDPRQCTFDQIRTL